MNQKGFTLIELLIVISIISFLASTFFPTLNEARAKGEDARRIASLKNLQTQIADQTNIGQIPYTSIFTTGDVAQRLQTLLSQTNVDQTNIDAKADAETYALVFPLKAGGYWCVDAEGVSKRTTARITAVTGPYSCALAVNQFTGPNTVDDTFTQGDTNGRAHAGIIQPDGKIILIGSFTVYNGVTVPRIVRLNSDGTLDAKFLSNINEFGSANPNLNPIAIKQQSDGSLLVNYIQNPSGPDGPYYLFKFNSDGIQDETVNFKTNGGAFAAQDIDLLSDGTIVSACGGAGVCFLAPDGKLTTQFDSFFGTIGGGQTAVRKVAVNSQDDIYVAGNFEKYGTHLVNGFVKINKDGKYDNGNAGGFDTSTILNVHVDSNLDRVFILGQFSTFKNNPVCNYAVIRDSDSTFDLDASACNFFAQTGALTGTSSVIPTSVTTLGDLVTIGGNLHWYGGESIGNIVKIKSEGKLVSNFDTDPISSEIGFNGGTRLVLAQPDGKIIVSGNFTAYNGMSVKSVVRLNP